MLTIARPQEGENMRSPMYTATGSLIVVQEQRFHLLTNRGQGLLLTLAHTAPVQIDDLCRWYAAQVSDHGVNSLKINGLIS